MSRDRTDSIGRGTAIYAIRTRLYMYVDGYSSLYRKRNAEFMSGEKENNTLQDQNYYLLYSIVLQTQQQSHNSVGCLWHSHGKNPVRLYPKLQSQPIGLPKIFIDYLFFQADQSDCTKSVSIFNRLAPSEER